MPFHTWTGPNGRQRTDIALSEIEEVILRPPPGYWSQGNGQAMVEYLLPQGIATLIVSPNPLHGIYLHYVKGRPKQREIWLSLWDPARLSEVAEACDEWYASVGLFLPSSVAWIGIREFCLSGQRSELIRWIAPEDIPPEGNY